MLWASWSEQSTALVETLERLVRARDGRLVLAAADADRSPQLVQAFQAQAIPTVVAVIAGQPVPLFAGVQPDDVIEQVFDQLLELGAQHGVTGRVDADGERVRLTAPAEPVEEPLPPLHQEAYDAIERGDFAAAASAYRTAIAQDPRDSLAVAGLAQANLLGRLQGKTLDEIRNAAASAPDDLTAQLDVADLDLSGGHVDDAFDRLLTLFPKLDADGKRAVRERLRRALRGRRHRRPARGRGPPPPHQPALLTDRAAARPTAAVAAGSACRALPRMPRLTPRA